MFDSKKLLRHKKVIQEINRHKWLESEIAGYDIGYQAAAESWLKKHAAAWMAYHMPNVKLAPIKKAPAKKASSIKTVIKKEMSKKETKKPIKKSINTTTKKKRS